MVKAIIARLKEGSIKDVVLFSNSVQFPGPPYVVVKPETGIRENTRQFRIIVHHKEGMFDELQQYTLVELDKLLSGTIADDDGSRFKLHKAGYTDITAEPEGDTYFMEKLYMIPMLGTH